jgi:hypothetical protein
VRTRLSLVFFALGSLLVLRAFGDWGYDYKFWDQMDECDDYAGASWIDYDTPSDALTADDFLCTTAGPITEIRFAGWSYYGEQYITRFRITFWDDVPATADDESHPGDLLQECWIDPADPNDPLKIGWYSPGEFCPYVYEYRIDLPEDCWFFQEGTPQDPVIYWIGIQGVMVTDGYFDAWYWNFRERHLPVNLDDAAFQSDYFGYPPWANWGFTAGYGDPDLYEGTLPEGWTSADMMFQLRGVPEPSSFAVLGLGLLALLRRRKK